MIIENKNLSHSGFTLTPNPRSAGILPAYGLACCKKSILRLSHAPKIIGQMTDMSSFSLGDDIDIGGLCIKTMASDTVVVPMELLPFYGIIKACVTNEFAADKNAYDRQFALTITRCNVRAGNANRPDAGHWHRHPPSARLDRAERIQMTRNYVITDNCGTEFLAGRASAFDLLDPRLAPTHIVPAGAIGVFASSSLHRSPPLPVDGRRTVLIMISYAKNAEGPSYANPLIDRLARAKDRARLSLLSNWRANERFIANNCQPHLPKALSRQSVFVLAA